MPAPLRLTLLVNPRAGKGQGAAAGTASARALQDAGAQVTMLWGDSAEQTRSLALRAVRDGPDSVVVVGGDGTLTGIVELLADARVPVTLVPAGTGNDLARALGIRTDDPAAAALTALNGRRRRIDLGSVDSQGEHRAFLTVVALGFDAKVSERTNTLKHPRGPLRYYLALLLELLRLRPTAFSVRVDDGPLQSMPGTLLAIGNTTCYGGGMPICEGAQPDDGSLDVVHVAPLGRLRLLSLFPLLLRGTHLDRPEVAHRRATRVHVSAPDLVAYADGERVGSGECTISIRPRAVTVMTPHE